MPGPAPQHLTQSDHQLVSGAVAAAESRTNGEIVTVVARRSDEYRETAFAWASIAALAALLFVAAFPAEYQATVLHVTGGWADDYGVRTWLMLMVLFGATKWISVFLILQWRPLRLWFTPRGVKARRVRARAVKLFRVSAESRTEARTGVLLYLSLDEHRADIVADSAIAAKVDAALWGDAMAALLTHVRAGQMGLGMAEAVTMMCAVLADHFPKCDDNPNELPDRLIEL